MDSPGFPPDRVLIYKQIGEARLTLDLFLPTDHLISDRRTGIVFFFGGGWKSGSPSQFHPQCRYLASRGMVAMSAEYRVQSRHGTSPRECVQDGKSAVRWIRAHAAELGLDPDRLAAGGGSAGGHVAAATATATGFDEPGEDASASCRPDALCLFNPVFDNSAQGYGFDRVQAYWQAISPMHNLSATTPPTVVFLGTEDEHIPVATAEEYQRRMHALGRRCDLHLYAGQPHGFFNHSHREMYRQTTIAMDRFLASLGFLTGDPTLP